MEVDQAKLNRLQDAVRYANSSRKYNSDFYYTVITLGDEVDEEVYQSADDFLIKMEKKKQQELKAKQRAEEKKNETALARKKKQLEKLKKELGE